MHSSRARRKTNNALLKAVVRAYLWKRQLEEGKYESVKELSVKISIGTRRIQQILRLNYLAPKIKEDIVNGRQPSNLRRATQQPTVVTAETTTARSEKVLQDTIGNIETPADAYENSNKSSLEESIEHKPCENSNESNTIAIKDIAASIEKLDNTGICENSTTNIFTEIAAQPTLSTADSTDKANTLSSTEMKSCFDNGSSKENTADKKEKPSMQQRQAILAGVVGAVLLVSCIASYLLIEYSKAHVIAVIGGIVGLVCVSFALYNITNPNTKLEKMEDIEQLDSQNLKTSGMLERP
ncbi:uncharacterized protein TNCT_326821 [Trichonephila clavata]|uniref:Uncharacterized protein n=1 Tax=Trichonephila clavata TaxID=2740835 RepID=A0A8X6K9H8_TRICU|nr:uncharacterized protein TNCT_326821 [Trichonephila clavata]